MPAAKNQTSEDQVPPTQPEKARLNDWKDWIRRLVGDATGLYVKNVNGVERSGDALKIDGTAWADPYEVGWQKPHQMQLTLMSGVMLIKLKYYYNGAVARVGGIPYHLPKPFLKPEAKPLFNKPDDWWTDKSITSE